MQSPATTSRSQPTAIESPAPSISSVEREEFHLAERVERALNATGYGSLRGVVVSVHARMVILAGQVPSYHLKQIAQTAALAVPGAHQVRNDLHVCRSV